MRASQQHNDSFFELVATRWHGFNTVICVGLDSDYSRIPESIKRRSRDPEQSLARFNRDIVDATAEFACAFKPNIAFYERQGVDGLRALLSTIEYIHTKYQG